VTTFPIGELADEPIDPTPSPKIRRAQNLIDSEPLSHFDPTGYLLEVKGHAEAIDAATMKLLSIFRLTGARYEAIAGRVRHCDGLASPRPGIE
jgi:hypothetical protein